MTERDYVLGTHDEEIARLGIQHRVWRPRVLDCWQRAGLRPGWRVLDVGAGPGYATLDLAEIVGPAGEVVALERSSRFLRHAEQACRERGLAQVRLLEVDLAEPLQLEGFDAAWCRWVAAFVPAPATLIASIARALKPGGVAIFHEYADYGTWRLAPRKPAVESFVQKVMEAWRASGGEPDIALLLPTMLENAGLRMRHLAPVISALRPQEFGWLWLASFVESGLKRLQDLGRADAAWAETVRREFLQAETEPATVMITPLVFEIIAERA